MPVIDPLHKKEIEDKVEVLFEEKNFYFYNAKGQYQNHESDEIERLIIDCMNSDRCHITNGHLEPIHHQEDERKIIVE